MSDARDTRTVDDVRGDAMSGKLKTEDDTQAALDRLAVIARAKSCDGNGDAPVAATPSALALLTLSAFLEALAQMPEANSAPMTPLFVDLYNAASASEADFRYLCDAAEAVLNAIERY